MSKRVYFIVDHYVAVEAFAVKARNKEEAERKFRERNDGPETDPEVRMILSGSPFLDETKVLTQAEYERYYPG